MEKLQTLFKNQNLLNQALTHKSWVNEHPRQRESNERLEFLGDAVLEFVITRFLFESFPHRQEGYLTALRAKLVNTQNLADLAIKLAVGEQIFLSKGEEESGGRTNPSLLADTLEAIIGALFLDQGLGQVEAFIRQNLITEIPQKVSQPLKDPKSLLQEQIQAKGLAAPKYKVVSESGPDHEKQFMVQVYVQDQPAGKGAGKSKSLAEQAAAQEALDKLAQKG